MENENANPESGKQDPSNAGGVVDLSSVKRKRGRPPGSKSVKTLPPSLSPQSAPRNENTATLDAKFLGETAICLLEIVDEVSAKVLVAKIKKIAPDKVESFVELHAEVGLNDKDKKVVGLSVEAIARKYTLLARFGPEVLLFAALSQYGLRQARLHQFVGQIASERAKEKEKMP